jgi:hypothetical protein
MRESKINNSSFYDMKRGQDYRLYVEGCELYMKLQSSRFLSKEHRVL